MLQWVSINLVVWGPKTFNHMSALKNRILRNTFYNLVWQLKRLMMVFKKYRRMEFKICLSIGLLSVWCIQVQIIKCINVIENYCLQSRIWLCSSWMTLCLQIFLQQTNSLRISGVWATDAPSKRWWEKRGGSCFIKWTCARKRTHSELLHSSSSLVVSFSFRLFVVWRPFEHLCGFTCSVAAWRSFYLWSRPFMCPASSIFIDLWNGVFYSIVCFSNPQDGFHKSIWTVFMSFVKQTILHFFNQHVFFLK